MMKYIAIVVAVGVAVTGFFVVSNRSTSQPKESPGVAQGSYRLIVLSDTVSLTHNGKTQVVEGTVQVYEGDQVATSATGRARLSWPNKTTTTLEEDSKIIIKELSDGGSKSRIELLAGDIWSKVSRILGPGEHYEVQTQETIAAVRGTIFRTTYRGRHTRIQGVEHVVRVSLKKSDGTADESTTIDVEEENQAEFDGSSSGPRRFQLRRLTSAELKDRILERIRRERDLDDDHVLRSTPSPTPSKTPQPTLTPRPTLTPTPKATVIINLTPVVTATPTPTSTPQPTPTPLPPVTLESAFPRTIASGDTFSLEGKNFTSGRNVSRIQSVSVGGKAVSSFSVISGGTSIFVTPAPLSPGTYDVTVVTTDGDTVTLSAGVTIQ